MCDVNKFFQWASRLPLKNDFKILKAITATADFSQYLNTKNQLFWNCHFCTFFDDPIHLWLPILLRLNSWSVFVYTALHNTPRPLTNHSISIWRRCLSIMSSNCHRQFLFDCQPHCFAKHTLMLSPQIRLTDYTCTRVFVFLSLQVFFTSPKSSAFFQPRTYCTLVSCTFRTSASNPISIVLLLTINTRRGIPKPSLIAIISPLSPSFSSVTSPPLLKSLLLHQFPHISFLIFLLCISGQN